MVMTHNKPRMKYSFYTSLVSFKPYNERTGDAEVVGFLENGKRTDGGGHTTSLSDFIILVVDILIHGTSRFQVTRLTRSSGSILLKLLTTNHYEKQRGLRREFVNHDGEFHINLKTFGRPLVGDGNIVNISTRHSK